MEYNLSQIEEIIRKTLDIIDYVETAKLQDRRTTIYLGNGNTISYSIPNNSIAHLIGIDTKYLESTGLYSTRNSFDTLKKFCDSSYQTYSLIRDGHLNSKNVFSEQIFEKLAAFKENIKMNVDETEFVCEYSKDSAYYSSEIVEDCNYIMVKKYDDNKIGVLFLIKNLNYYVPMSNQIFNNMEEFKEAFADKLRNQELTLITGQTTYNVKSDFKKTFPLTLNQRAEKLANLKLYKKQFNCHIDVTSDFEYTLDKLTSNRDRHFENNDTINDIVTAIVSRSIINRDLYFDSTLLPIIDSWNDYICQNPNSSNNSNSQKYTDVLKDLAAFKSLVESLTSKNEELQNKVTTLEEENSSFKKDIEEKDEIIQSVYKLVKPRN